MIAADFPNCLHCPAIQLAELFFLRFCQVYFFKAFATDTAQTQQNGSKQGKSAYGPELGQPAFNMIKAQAELIIADEPCAMMKYRQSGADTLSLSDFALIWRASAAIMSH